MKHDQTCRQMRELWIKRFDSHAPEVELLPAVARHLEQCPGCREFILGAEAVRTLVAAVPLPPPDPAADHALLAALAQPLRSAPRRQSWLDFLINGVRRRPVLVAGAASFLITLGAGVALTVAPVAVPVATAPVSEPAPTRRAERDYDAHLDAWIASPAARLRPPRVLSPSPRRTSPARLRERSERSPRSHTV